MAFSLHASRVVYRKRVRKRSAIYGAQFSYQFAVHDASGNYAGGFYYGQHFRPANPNQCYELNEELNYVISRDEIPGGLGNASAVVPFYVQLISAKFVTYVDNWVTAPHFSSFIDLLFTKTIKF